MMQQMQGMQMQHSMPNMISLAPNQKVQCYGNLTNLELYRLHVLFLVIWKQVWSVKL